jgi:hypothetical protein
MSRAIEMRFKDDAILAEFAEVAEAPDLEAAAIGENGAIPMHKRVEAAEGRDQGRAGAEHQMVGIGENNFRACRL